MLGHHAALKYAMRTATPLMVTSANPIADVGTMFAPAVAVEMTLI